MEKICVAVRVRPPTTQDISEGTHWNVEHNRISLHKPLGTPVSGASYTFDHVFDQNCTNAGIYELLTKDIIRAAVEGFNGTAFAYGQTSSGKTYTMNGSDNDPGIIHRAVKDVFQNIQMMTNREFLIRVSYMEIYNEEINDLFAPDNQKLQIHESLERGIFVAGLREEIVNSAEQVLKLLESGEANRHFGETNMNARSSRSHTIFRMVIESKGKDNSGHYSNLDAIRVSVLNLVDLAGSERIVKTGAGGIRLKEGKHINKSLLVLGNVINKLSDGGKQRGHIPYRDSKLTRILQPALGGNAKTSIICTVAPEEVHIEETKGTLQFASRAKSITNCAQVNEILTDAALLRRQKLEIEELRQKLQGSRSEVLEQEILKLRNDMLKYELEREKLAMELEEERKSHKERERCIREQQMKIDDLSNLVTSSDHDKRSAQEQVSIAQNLNEGNADKPNICDKDSFHTPCLKADRNGFVAKRSNYSRPAEFSPVPDSFGDVADEDMWLRMNKGYTADLDSLQFTPARRTQSLSLTEISPGYSIEYYKEEVQNLKRQLENAVGEKNELERNHAKQLLLNNRLMEEIYELQQESILIREIPQKLCESVTNCKDIYKDILSIMQSFVADEKSLTAKLLSSTSEIGIQLLSTLEAQFSIATDGHNVSTREGSLVQEQGKVIFEKLNSTISTLVSSQALTVVDEHQINPGTPSEHKESASEGANASWKEEMSNELDAIKERYHILEKEFDLNNQLLEACKERFYNLERECNILKEERTSLFEKLSISDKKLDLVHDQNEKISKDLNTEIQRREKLEEEIKQFSVAFAHRQGSFKSFNNELKAKIENLRALNSVPISKPLGY
ncbi:Kinesin [Macleaya cordata]|uniref:Kinesin-like protein n=1 Tax=Macleaya cordata TaxID=56857 RepID=A0A200QG75_MACCD|nr:Kinesin [Macleaya cordata]